MKAILFVLFFFQAGPVYGGGLSTPFTINTARVLPKGVRSVQVQGVTTQVDGWYNDGGVVTGVAEPFNQKLSYGRLLKAEPNLNTKINVEAQLQNQNINLDQIAGTSFADINTRVMATVPTIAYGLSERWTLALAVPIVYTKQEIATGFVGTGELQEVIDGFAQKSGKQTQVIQQKLSDVIATELASKGYKPLVDQERTQIGDVVLAAKYLAAKGLSYSWAILNTFTFPTAHVRDVSRVADPTPGDGQFDYGVSSIVEVPITAKFKWLNQTGYTIQFADTRETRIPHSIDERLSKDIDFGASRDLGDQVFTSFSALYNPTDMLSLGGSYTIAYKERDVWRGSQASADRYDVLGVETEQFMQAVYIQTGFSSLQAFRRKDFPLPMMATLGVGKVIDGRNVRNDPLWSMNMTLFF